MEQQTQEQQLRNLAEKRAEAKLDFRNHLILYLAVRRQRIRPFRFGQGL